MKGLAEVLKIKTESLTVDDIEQRMNRQRELYNRELRKGVELGRKLGAFERRFGNLRNYVTDIVGKAVVSGGFSDTDPAMKILRNTVRVMKGKNKI